MNWLYLGLTEEEEKILTDHLRTMKRPVTLRAIYEFMVQQFKEDGSFMNCNAVVQDNNVLVQRTIGW